MEYLRGKLEEHGRRILWLSGALVGSAVSNFFFLMVPRYGVRIYIALALLTMAWIFILLREQKRCLNRMKAEILNYQQAREGRE